VIYCKLGPFYKTGCPWRLEKLENLENVFQQLIRLEILEKRIFNSSYLISESS